MEAVSQCQDSMHMRYFEPHLDQHRLKNIAIRGMLFLFLIGNFHHGGGSMRRLSSGTSLHRVLQDSL